MVMRRGPGRASMFGYLDAPSVARLQLPATLMVAYRQDEGTYSVLSVLPEGILQIQLTEPVDCVGDKASVAVLPIAPLASGPP